MKRAYAKAVLNPSDRRHALAVTQAPPDRVGPSLPQRLRRRIAIAMEKLRGLRDA
jgi:hypothetical protein